MIKISCLWLFVFAAFLSFQVSSATAQEAVPEKADSQAEITPTEKASPEEAQVEATPTPAPEKKQSAVKSDKSLQEMSAEEKAAAGLDKLSPQELEYLDEWMRTRKQAAEKKAAAQATEKVKAETAKIVGEEKHKTFLGMGQAQEALVSRVNGEMIRLNGRTIITLEDGTRWKQANKDDRYQPRVTDHPAVAVFQTQFGFKMRIEGMPDFYVDPVRD